MDALAPPCTGQTCKPLGLNKSVKQSDRVLSRRNSLASPANAFPACMCFLSGQHVKLGRQAGLCSQFAQLCHVIKVVRLRHPAHAFVELPFS